MNSLNTLTVRQGTSISFSKSTEKCVPILCAIGVIICIGSMGVAGCLFPDLGWKALAIGGGGCICGIVCFLFAGYYQVNSKKIKSRALIQH